MKDDGRCNCCIESKYRESEQRKRHLLFWSRRIPHIFLTNGGGVTELQKSIELKTKLAVPVDPAQVVLSHTPMKSLVGQFKDSQVLVIGPESCRDVAKGYGFNRVLLPEEIHASFPSIWPFSQPGSVEHSVDFATTPIKAILVFHESQDWGRDLQICCDVLRSVKGFLGTESGCYVQGGVIKNFDQDVKIYFSNPDFVWRNEFTLVRFTQGAFRMALGHVFENLTGHAMKLTLYGKPEQTTYEYATRVLSEVSHSVFNESRHGRQSTHERAVYAIGDNPSSDIYGANRHGWKSVLVRTGVFEGDETLLKEVHRPTFVTDNVLEAVEKILEVERVV